MLSLGKVRCMLTGHEMEVVNTETLEEPCPGNNGVETYRVDTECVRCRRESEEFMRHEVANPENEWGSAGLCSGCRYRYDCPTGRSPYTVPGGPREPFMVEWCGDFQKVSKVK